MPDKERIPDVTTRHGFVNTPASTTFCRSARHQPDTPVNKKFATKTAAPKKRRTKTKTDSPPTLEKPPGENDHVPAATSENNGS